MENRRGPRAGHDWTSTWLTPSRTVPGAGWFGVFNRDGKSPREVSVDAVATGISSGNRGYDIWNRRDLGTLKSLRVVLGPDEVLFVRYGP